MFIENRLNGLILYNIQFDGCLNGVFTNDSEGVDGVIYNEIARKIRHINANQDPILGVYNSSYTDIDNQVIITELTIEPSVNRRNAFLSLGELKKRYYL